jgi:hypothetical protein
MRFLPDCRAGTGRAAQIVYLYRDSAADFSWRRNAERDGNLFAEFYATY